MGIFSTHNSVCGFGTAGHRQQSYSGIQTICHVPEVQTAGAIRSLRKRVHGRCNGKYPERNAATKLAVIRI